VRISRIRLSDKVHPFAYGKRPESHFHGSPFRFRHPSAGRGGDSALNGQINGSDFSLRAAGGSGAGSGWTFGDYDYSGGKPNGTDFSLFGAGLSSYRQFGQFDRSLQSRHTSEASAFPRAVNRKLFAVEN